VCRLERFQGTGMSATSFVYHNRDALSRTTPISVAHSMGLQHSREPQLKRESDECVTRGATHRRYVKAECSSPPHWVGDSSGTPQSAVRITSEVFRLNQRSP
jgi:hypothetical protein